MTMAATETEQKMPTTAAAFRLKRETPNTRKGEHNMTKEQYFEELAELEARRDELKQAAVEMAFDVIHEEYPELQLTAAEGHLCGNHVVRICLENRDRFDVDLHTGKVLYVGSSFLILCRAISRNRETYIVERREESVVVIAWDSYGHAAVMRFDAHTLRLDGRIDFPAVRYEKSKPYIRYDQEKIYRDRVAG